MRYPEPNDGAALAAAIAESEAELERLAEAAEQARKLLTLGRIAAWAGGLALVPTLLGLLPLGAAAFMVEIAALLGGVVLAGVNRRSRDDLLAAIKAEEQRRAGLIDALPLHAADPAADEPGRLSATLH
jgi:hypothetical protein